MDLACFRIGHGGNRTWESSVSALNVVEHLGQPVIAENDPRWRASRHTGSSLIGPGAAGCWLAHYDTWKKVADLSHFGGVALVLEADSQITRYGQKHLSEVVSRMVRQELDLVHVGRGVIGGEEAGRDYRKRFVSMPARRIADRFTPFLMEGFSWRTHAYLVSHKCAEELLNAGVHFEMPVDEWLIRAGNDMPVRARSVFQSLFLPDNSPSMVDQLGR